MALDGVLANIPGLAGYLAMQRHQQQQALGGLQGAMGVLQAVQRQEEMQREAQLAPLRMQAMQAQVQQAQAAADQQRRRDAFFASAPQFMTQGPPEVAPGRGVMGGMDDGSTGQIMGVAPGENGAPAAKPGPMQFDLDRFVTQGAMQGVFSPEALLNRQQQMEARRDALQQRMQELQLRLADARTTAQERMQLQRDLAEMQMNLRRDIVASRQSSGGSDGDSRREPFRFSLDGKDVQGMRDRFGNVYMPDGRAVTNYGPPITPADRKAIEDNRRGEIRDAALTSRTELIIGKVDEALKNVGYLSSGFIGQQLGKVAGTPAYNLDRTVDTIKANIGFQELQAMREASPTGGALGQVAVRELDMLQAVISSLDIGQSPAQLRKNLEAIGTHYRNWKSIVDRAKRTPGANPSSGASGSGNAETPPAGVDPRLWNAMSPEDRALWKK